MKQNAASRGSHDPEPTHWADDDAFWAAMEPALCSEARLKVAERDVTAMCQGLGLAKPVRVLDLACGPGAHAIAFSARGHTVTGLDRTERYLQRARRASAEHGVAVEWIQGDMRTFRRPDHFDVVCSLYNSFGYFDEAGDGQVLESVRTSLRSGGRFLLDLQSRETVSAHWRDRQSAEVDGVSYVEVRSMSHGGTALESDWLIARGSEQLRFRVTQRLYSGGELSSLLQQVGYSEVRLFSDLACSIRFGEAPSRLVVLAAR